MHFKYMTMEVEDGQNWVEIQEKYEKKKALKIRV